MPLDELHEEVARVALGAAAAHGFALGGGNALIAHGIISRPTEDVDLFTNEERGVEAASASVQDALRAAGYQAEPVDKTAGLDDIFYEMGEGLAEWTVIAPGGRHMSLQMAYFERHGQPVIMEFGPVLDVEDAVGGKVAALATRAYTRDYLDASAALSRYSADDLVRFARRLDPGLADEDFADAGARLDQLGDDRFTEAGASPQDVAELRQRFAAWPRGAAPRPDPDPSADLGTGLAWAPGPEADTRAPDPQADFEAEQ